MSAVPSPRPVLPREGSGRAVADAGAWRRARVAAALLAVSASWAGAAGAQTTAPARAAASSASVAAAAADLTSSGWARLTAPQRAVLAPLAREWGMLDATQRQRWLEVATFYPKLPPVEQQRVQARMAEWVGMTPAERGRTRLGFQETRQVAPDKRQERWEMYQTLPAEARKVLADRQQPPARPAARPGSAPPIGVSRPKDNTVPLPQVTSGAVLMPVSPTVVQVSPGATTTLMTQPPAPPMHQRPGQPKIIARPGEVDPLTLLPRVGPQAAPPASARR